MNIIQLHNLNMYDYDILKIIRLNDMAYYMIMHEIYSIFYNYDIANYMITFIIEYYMIMMY